MRQPNLSGLPAFADSPLTVPYAAYAGMKTEADVIRACIDYAMEERGLSQKQIALMCGWRSDSFLSELASEGATKLMPARRLALFALATGTHMLSQWRERQEADRQIAGKPTSRDRSRGAVAVMREAARQAA